MVTIDTSGKFETEITRDEDGTLEITFRFTNVTVENVITQNELINSIEDLFKQLEAMGMLYDDEDDEDELLANFEQLKLFDEEDDGADE